ncbi:Hypothetical predicted protein [Mytilus galloprovincialis]|uniref:Uncharacterized protein n=1 Tax=Mytilus galloprovincialis TaxID=29158 RepID=A0A8B6G402_MYTGA|nr:Hypothetical predicted protein [Mytilus galloprovincialis]
MAQVLKPNCSQLAGKNESVKDVLILLCGKDDSIENVHESILLANSVGARGQRLSNQSTDTPAAKGSKERQDISDAPPTSAPAFPFPGYGYQNLGFGFPYPNFYPGPNYNSGGFRPPRMQGGRGRRESNGNIRDHEPLAKKEKFEPEIPDWELKSGFDPSSVK